MYEPPRNLRLKHISLENDQAFESIEQTIEEFNKFYLKISKKERKDMRQSMTKK